MLWQYVTASLQRYQRLSNYFPFMCHEQRNMENQSRPSKFDPCVLCSYDVDCEDVADLRTKVGRASYALDLSDMACDWRSYIANGREPPSWRIARRLMSTGCAGMIAPSFAPGATAANLVLWKWGDQLPYRVVVYDPRNRLPKNQLLWE